jgi:hypothetical protein
MPHWVCLQRLETPSRIAVLIDVKASRSVILGILGLNGWSNLAGVIAGQLFKKKYAPLVRPRFPFSDLTSPLHPFSFPHPFALLTFFPDNFPLKATTILIAVAVSGFILVRSSYMLLNRKRKRVTADWTEEQFEDEANSEERKHDYKMTFLYGY